MATETDSGATRRGLRRPGLASRRIPLRLNDAELAARHGEDRKFVWSLARAFELLHAFRPGQGPLGNAELSARTGLPKATVTRLTYTLTQLGYLRQSELDGRYQPSPALLAIAYPVLANIGIRQMAQERMQRLADHTGASVALSSPDGDMMIYVSACSSSALDALLLDIGSRVGMTQSAAGRAYLSSLEDDEREAMFEHFAGRLGPDWADLKPRILDSIAEIRERGFCYVDREWREDVRAVATPIADLDGTTRMALTVGGPAFALAPEQMVEDFGPRLVHLARGLSRAPMR
ncbi:transcriptional regulator, IclR family [Albimonas donghaensis]|uniref:Transcriptional regulator, IclR family n=1 Tax=Albimonas donghaensis TaxID=356660 RepID=A0A1H3ENQ7_9RHOB|nr:IclR family transcriptional regulator [Albimonas donghaensis]SDX80250.1 transcriptional regulator, IclR family [Albimonas donghaensis]